MQEEVLIEARKLISSFLANRRKELNITQEQLSIETGMGIATIKRFESGKFWLNMKQYLLLCHHLRCYPFLAEYEADNEFSKLMRERWSRKNDKN